MDHIVSVTLFETDSHFTYVTRKKFNLCHVKNVVFFSVDRGHWKKIRSKQDIHVTEHITEQYINYRDENTSLQRALLVRSMSYPGRVRSPSVCSSDLSSR